MLTSILAPLLLIQVRQYTPLESACSRAQIQNVERLLKAITPGKDALDNDKNAIYRTVSKSDHPADREKILQMLVDTGHDLMKSDRNNPLKIATQHGTPGMVNILLKAGMNPDFGSRNRSALYYAIELDRTDIVKLLLDAGASPSLPCASRETKSGRPVLPVQLASYVGSVGSLNHLIKAGADLRQLSVNGETPLHSAVLGKSPETMIPLLLKLRIDPKLKNSQGETPLDVAKRKKLPKAVELLSKVS